MFLYKFIVPSPALSLTSSNITTGSTATLTCNATFTSLESYSSDFTVTLQLMKTDGQTIMSRNFGTLNDSIQASFVIQNSTMDTSGAYRCTANSTYSGENKNFVMIHSPIVSNTATVVVYGLFLLIVVRFNINIVIL